MNIANYLTTQTSRGESGVYPLSTQTLDFIQQQILFTQKICKILGYERCLLIEPTESEDGLMLFDGELLPVKASSPHSRIYYKVISENEDVTADGITYLAARTRRYIQFTREAGPDSYSVNYDMISIKTLKELDDKFTAISSDIEKIKKAKEESGALLELKKKVEALTTTKTNKDLENTLETLRGEVSRLSSSLKASEAKIQKCESSRVFLENQINDLRFQISELESRPRDPYNREYFN